MASFCKKIGSIFLCGALISALVPGNIVLSAKGDALAGTGSFAEPSDDVLLEKGKVGKTGDGTESEGLSIEENENLGSISGDTSTIEKSKKDTKGNKIENKSSYAKLDESNPWGKDTAKIAGGAVVGGAGIVATNAVVGKAIGSSTAKKLDEKIREELRDFERKLDRVVDKIYFQNKESEDVYMNRVWLWGVMSYLFEKLGWFGENEKGIKELATEDGNIRGLVSFFWLLISIFLTIYLYFCWSSLENDIEKYEKNCLELVKFFKRARNIIVFPDVILTWFCPPVGFMYFFIATSIFQNLKGEKFKKVKKKIKEEDAEFENYRNYDITDYR